MIKINRFYNGKMGIFRSNEDSTHPADWVLKHAYFAEDGETIGRIKKADKTYQLIAADKEDTSLLAVAENDYFFANIEDIVLKQGESIIINVGGMETSYSPKPEKLTIKLKPKREATASEWVKAQDIIVRAHEDTTGDVVFATSTYCNSKNFTVTIFSSNGETRYRYPNCDIFNILYGSSWSCYR